MGATSTPNAALPERGVPREGVEWISGGEFLMARKIFIRRRHRFTGFASVASGSIVIR